MSEESSIYLFFRSIIKFFIHKVTGESEVQRVSRRGDIPALQRSINLSKMLAGYRRNHCNWEQPYSHELVEELCSIKHIQNSDSKFRIDVSLKALHSWKHAIFKVEQIRKITYNSQNSEHEEKLMDIWRCLRPNRKIKNRKSDEWIELGFQVDDPATDFRGAGVLGLINLHGWVSKQHGKDAFIVADTPETTYFFASASLFLTMLSIQLLKEGLISPQYWVANSEQSITDLFQNLFEQIWRLFAVYWLQVEDKSLMQFNINLLKFSRLIKEERSPQISQKVMIQKINN